jgi:sn-glycerol 3-phosphate transport system ATP-binding protein
MNFMPAKADGGVRFSLLAGGSATAAAGGAVAGRAVTVGIRPEHLIPVAEADALVGGVVEMVEQLGADTLVHIVHGETTIVARMPHGGHPEIGTTLHLSADPEHVFLFDTTSGARIR